MLLLSFLLTVDMPFVSIYYVVFIHLLFVVDETLLYKVINLQDLSNNFLKWDSPTAMVLWQKSTVAILALIA